MKNPRSLKCPTISLLLILIANFASAEVIPIEWQGQQGFFLTREDAEDIAGVFAENEYLREQVVELELERGGLLSELDSVNQNHAQEIQTLRRAHFKDILIAVLVSLGVGLITGVLIDAE